MNPSSARSGTGRSALFDNLKVLLIFLVVFAHLLEAHQGGAWSNTLYLIIYSFHMPVFIFVSGWFSRHSTVKKTLTKILPPYLVFQVLYLLFVGQPIQFYSPYWILWYLFALLIWRLILPILKLWKPLAYIMLPVSVVLSLLGGYADWIGYTFSLSRLLVFWPYFLLGYCMAGNPDLPDHLRSAGSRAFSLLAAIGCTGFLILTRNTLQCTWMYGSTGYTASGGSAQMRLFLLMLALLWLWFLLAWTPKVSLPVLSVIGQNTLFVYLLHGFFKIAIQNHAEAIYCYSPGVNLAIALVFALLLTGILGSPALAKLWKTIKTGVLSLFHRHPTPTPVP